jgi:hypothetical protein
MQNTDEAQEIPTDDEPDIKRDYRELAKSKYKPITFVKASSSQLPTLPSQKLGDLYLSLVLPSYSTLQETQSAPASPNLTPEAEKCPVCGFPLLDDPKHATSIAHQACLPHSHVPSALDRRRKGLAYLQDHGWDPDARVGLGTGGREGRLYPVLPKAKKGRAGIAENADEETTMKKRKVAVEEPVQLKSAKVLKKEAKEDKKRRDKLQKLFYADSSVLQYLGDDF